MGMNKSVIAFGQREEEIKSRIDRNKVKEKSAKEILDKLNY